MPRYIDQDKVELILEHALERDDRTFEDRGDERLAKAWNAIYSSLEQVKALPYIEMPTGRKE